MKKFYPKKKFYQPTLVLGNNTGADVAIQVFNRNNSGDTSSFNAFKQYQWNLTGTNFAGTTGISIQVQSVGGTMTTITKNGNFTTMSSVIAALNSLNVGLFYQSTVSGQLFANVYNDKIIYGTLNVNGAIGNNMWTVSGFLKANSLGVNDQMGYFFTDTTTTQSLSSGAVGPPVPPLEVFTFNDNIAYPFSKLANGDTVQLIIISDSLIPSPFTFNTVLKQNGVTIINDTQSAVGFVIFTFPYLANAVYNLQATIS